MIARKTNSQRVPPCSAREGEGGATLSPDLHNVTSDPSAITAKGRHPFRDDLTDQPRLVFIGRPFAVPFLFVPFHSAACSQTGGKNNAR